MKKIDNLTTIILFAVFLLTLGIGGWMLRDQSFSENENRYLQQKPQISAASILSGEFEETFQNYQDDQFPFRNSWITLKTASKLALFSKDLNGVYLGKDGYLIEKISEEDADRELFTANLQTIKEFCQRLPEGISKSVILVPTTAAIMDRKLPTGARPFDETSFAEEAAEQLKNLNYVDLYAAFKGEKGSQIYYKTDHHWTTEGARLAYGAWRRKMGKSDASLKELKKEVLSSDFQGTLYSKVLWDDGTRDQVTAYIGSAQENWHVIADNKDIGGIYQKKYVNEKDKYAVFFGGNYGRLEIKTGKKTGRNLLIIKDSFANAFAPFEAEDFDQVCMVDLRYFSGNLEAYLKENHITDLLVLYSMSDMTKDKNISVLQNGGDILS